MKQLYNRVSEAFLAEARALIGPEHVLTDTDALERYKTDEEADPRCFALPEAVLRPGTAAEVAALVKLCNRYLVPITVRGGGTGLNDGAIAQLGGVILLTERLNKILELNKEGLYLVAEAGARTLDIQRLAQEAGLLYAGDPCSADSCLIGGNLATNAGGNKAVRYGVTRHQVYGLELVTPTGELVTLGAPLQKCSTGYCLEQLVIGSEGTLGIITKVILKLQPLPPYKADVLAIFTQPLAAISIVGRLAAAGLNPTSVEYMDNANVRTTAVFTDFPAAPRQEDGIYVIISLEAFREEELYQKLEQLEALCTECGAVEVLEADERIWAMRRNCLEAVRLVSLVCTTDDVVVPVDQLSAMVSFVIQTVAKYPFPLRINAHIGDGNIHIVLCKMDLSDEEWEDNLARFAQEVYGYAYAHGGRLAGEHGIGSKKAAALAQFTPPGELELMRKIKRAWDPHWLLNPGKVLLPEEG